MYKEMELCRIASKGRQLYFITSILNRVWKLGSVKPTLLNETGDGFILYASYIKF